MRNTKTIVIGSGIAAVAVARRLLQKDTNAEILLLEAGQDLAIGQNRSYDEEVLRKWNDFVLTGKAPTKAFEDDLQDATITGTGNLVLAGSRLIVRGGSTNHWGGWCPRMKEEDFRLGEARKSSINWPIEYKNFAGYYTEAEAFIYVCGDSTSQSVPRYGQAYPHTAIPFTALDQLLIPTLNRLGYGYEALPLARKAHCMTTGTCRYCPLDARYAAGSDLTTLLGQFPGRIHLKIGSPATTIQMKNKRAVAGVNYVDMQTGNATFSAADRVIVAAGTIESAKLLLASKDYWPAGLGNDSGHVGRHLVSHPLLRAVGRLKFNKEYLEQEIDFPTMACRYFDSKQFQAQGKMFFVRDGKYVKFDDKAIAERLIAGEKPSDIDYIIENRTRIELRALIEAFPSPSNRVDIGTGKTKYGLLRSNIHYDEPVETKAARQTHMVALNNLLKEAGLENLPPLNSPDARADHATSTCRMAKRAADGVVDENLKVHQTDNLFVCSNAVLPNSGAVNPTLTLVALALRLGDHLAA